MTITLPVSLWFSTPFLVLSAVIFIFACWRAPWSALVAVKVRQHLWLGSIYMLGLISSFIQLPLSDAIVVHPLLMAASTVIFGPYLTLVSGFCALLLNEFISKISWYNTGFNYLSTVVIPCGVAHCMLFAISKIKIRNLFVFILGSGFFGGMFSFLISLISSSVLLWLFQPSLFYAAKSNIGMSLLLTFPEAFCNGVIVISLSVMAPHLVKTYNDSYYLGDDNSDSD